MSYLDRWYQEQKTYLEGIGVEIEPKISRDEKEALEEFMDVIGDMKSNSPQAWEAFKNQLLTFKDNILTASGISSGVSQIQSALAAPSRLFSQRFMFEMEKALGPMGTDMRYFLNDVSQHVEDWLLDNAIGATIGGIAGYVLGFLFGVPHLGSIAGTLVGAALFGAVSDLNQQWLDQETIARKSGEPYYVWGPGGYLKVTLDDTTPGTVQTPIVDRPPPVPRTNIMRAQQRVNRMSREWM